MELNRERFDHECVPFSIENAFRQKSVGLLRADTGRLLLRQVAGPVFLNLEFKKFVNSLQRFGTVRHDCDLSSSWCLREGVRDFPMLLLHYGDTGRDGIVNEHWNFKIVCCKHRGHVCQMLSDLSSTCRIIFIVDVDLDNSALAAVQSDVWFSRVRSPFLHLRACPRQTHADQWRLRALGTSWVLERKLSRWRVRDTPTEGSSLWFRFIISELSSFGCGRDSRNSARSP